MLGDSDSDPFLPTISPYYYIIIIIIIIIVRLSKALRASPGIINTAGESQHLQVTEVPYAQRSANQHKRPSPRLHRQKSPTLQLHSQVLFLTCHISSS